MTYSTVHRLTALSVCPADEEVVDVYDIAVIVKDLVLPIEEVMAAVDAFRGVTIWQEELTDQLAQTLNAEVRTWGNHSGVMTECRAKPNGEPLPTGPDPRLRPEPED